MSHILQIDASARTEGSVTRDLTRQIAARLGGTVDHLDLAATPLPQLTEDWVGANFTPVGDRTDAQKAVLSQSDDLIARVQAADTLVIGLPIYNFGLPSALKAWIDLIARAGVTFSYSPDGPKGLLTGKRAVIAVASGGTPVDSEIDYATPYLRHALGFIGIHDVTVIAADALGSDSDTKLAAATGQIEALAA
ncbi:FMN-dependent NADH-azoreductase [Jannaschia pagri]|uniref:FMN dependent NADH:quinone oxidoreductase n=1 Tax=Jannaschia pagri TaxID=2829797 RepID=A0ABQ4NLN8_9RHOB|nr:MULTISPECIES: NAD(P)H-dependent oxidoreductase [unclassified Jannaschia]GIT91190.1 FMN-dependent NADH-azoreductase [Jannaschia sp. AI_61]GIT95022.1 FMN-dependent NADH-azoreductase [Jannaschia sp. AI_62]